MADRKKPGWVFWTTVVLVGVPMLYVLSFGPACWWYSFHPLDGKTPEASRIYLPFGWMAVNGPWAMHDLIEWYGTLGIDSVDVRCEFTDSRKWVGFRREPEEISPDAAPPEGFTPRRPPASESRPASAE